MLRSFPERLPTIGCVLLLAGMALPSAAQQLAISPEQPLPTESVTVTVEGLAFTCPDMETYVGEGRIDILCRVFAPVIGGAAAKGVPLFSVEVGPLAPGVYEVNLIGVSFPGIPTPAPSIGLLARSRFWVLDPQSGLRRFRFTEGPTVDTVGIELTLSCGLPSDPSVSYAYELERLLTDGVISLGGFPVGTAQVCAPGQETWTYDVGPLTLRRGTYLVSLLAFLGFGEGEIETVFEAPLVVDPAAQEAVLVQGGRFSVRATWTKASGETGTARGRRLPDADDSASLYFFRPGNAELVVKVLDGCNANDRFWVFVAGLTNLGVELTVTDEVTGFAKTYVHAQGQPFAPIVDRASFTCPGMISPPPGD